jgi:hypothetical protein
MALGDRLAELESRVGKDGCSFGRFLLTLDPPTAEALGRLLATTVSNENLRMTLAQEGYRFSRDSIGNHRHGRCLCTAAKKENK